MRVRKKTAIGRIGANGVLSLPWDSFNEFCNQHRGKVAIVRIEIQPTEPSEKTANYYFGYIVPTMQSVFYEVYGERWTKSQTDQKIRELCPLFYEETRENGKWRARLKEFEELDQAEINDAISWLFQFAAENFNVVLQDAEGR